MFALVDCNNFFVSCERTQDPTLEGRAVVVLSNNDGCVVARSNEAKRMGIKMGQPAFEIREQIQRGLVVALSGNHLLYREISLRIHDIFRRFAPATLDYSIDEAFLLMDGIPASALPEIGEAIADTCAREEHIPVTVGFAPSKTLAKIATEIGKKQGQRVVMLAEEGEWQHYLDRLAVNDLWGIGRRLTKRLFAAGVYTAGQFAARPVEWVRGTFGVNGERTWRELHGESCIELEHLERPMQESISETRTFPTDITDYDYLRSRIARYCAHVSKRLRIMAGQTSEVTVFLRTNRFHTDRGYYAPTLTARVDPPIFDTQSITRVAIGLLDEIYRPGIGYKRAGVVLGAITPQASFAPSIFDDYRAQTEANDKARKLMQAIDHINAGPGAHSVKLATTLTVTHLGHNDGYSSSFGPPKKM